MEFQLFHTTLSASLLLFIMAGGFLAGFVDSIAGGGGLISLPVLLAAGLPPHLAIGTNKFSATFGAVMRPLSRVHSIAAKSAVPFSWALPAALILSYHRKSPLPVSPSRRKKMRKTRTPKSAENISFPMRYTA